MSNSTTQDRDGFSNLPTSDRSTRLIGLAIIFFTFGIFGSWAAFAPLDSAALAPGVVTVQSYRKTVQHLEGGIVKELLVHDGDVVEAGAPLIILDDTQLRAEFEMVKGQLIAAQATEARLQAERDDQSKIDFSKLLESNSPRALEARETETQVFKARRISYLGEISVLEKRIGQLNEQIKGLEAVIRSKGALDKSYSGEIRELNELLAEGFVDKQRLLDQERRQNMLKSEVADQRSEITKTQLQINETQLQILQRKKDFHSDVVTRLAEVQTKSFDLQERVNAVKDRISRSIIRAPDSGMVIGMSLHTVGGVVSPGTPLLDIVPSISDLIVEAQVLPQDIDRVDVGKTADIRFSAFNSSTTPVIEGVVTHISADRLVDQQTGMPYYLARIKLTDKGVRQLGELKLLPGMPAEVLINTGKRTMLQYLLQPAADIFAKSLIED